MEINIKKTSASEAEVLNIKKLEELFSLQNHPAVEVGSTKKFSCENGKVVVEENTWFPLRKIVLKPAKMDSYFLVEWMGNGTRALRCVHFEAIDPPLYDDSVEDKLYDDAT